jgi:hypothetical protein
MRRIETVQMSFFDTFMVVSCGFITTLMGRLSKPIINTSSGILHPFTFIALIDP